MFMGLQPLPCAYSVHTLRLTNPEDFQMQRGQIKHVGNCWLLRYYEPVLENGRVIKRQKTTKLILSPDTKPKDEEISARAAADLILAPINARTARPESRQDMQTFFEHVYLPHVQESKRPSTYKSYHTTWLLLKKHVNGLAMRDARTSDIDDILRSLAREKVRAHTTHRNFRNFLSGGFRFAIRRNVVERNPVRDVEIPRGKPARAKGVYSLDEIQKMLAILPEPARTVVIVAALTGLRMSEVKGLRWEDFKGNELHVARSVWGRHVLDTKTLTSKSPVPVLPIVRKALEAHQKRTPDMGFIFAGERSGNPLGLENMYRRDMRPLFEANKIEWRGWHSFRRGLGTNLNQLGADPKTIQGILRHSQLSTTMNIYVQPVSAVSHKAMKKIERAFTRSGKKIRPAG